VGFVVRSFRRATLFVAVSAMTTGVYATGAVAASVSAHHVGKVRIEVSTRAGGRLAMPATQQQRSGETWDQFQQRLREPTTSAAAAYAELSRLHNVHHLQADRLLKPAAGFPGEDWVTKEQCRTAFENQTFDGGWYYKNHYSACQVATVFFNSYVCDRTCRWVGTTTARMTVLGRGYHRQRTIDWDIYLDNFVRSWGTTYDYLRYVINVPCSTTNDGGECTSDQPSGVMRSLAQWRANGYASIHTTTTTPTPAAGDPHPEDKKALFKYQPMVSSFEAGDVSSTPATYGRCDSASYMTGPAGGCIFPGTYGILHFDYNEPRYKGSVEFIYQAMHHLDTLPGYQQGTYVPGGYFVQPVTGVFEEIHRNYYGDRSRSKITAKCIALYGPDYATGPNGESRDCDEYPFSATYENANYDHGEHPATWTVKPVASPENQAAGTALGVYYSFDHILDDDPFYVAIDNAP
jgi:hypothetical protein